MNNTEAAAMKYPTQAQIVLFIHTNNDTYEIDQVNQSCPHN
jgi:hypothetical protein